MESSDDRQRSTRTAEEAAEWLVRCRDEQLNQSARREFARWLRASPQNVAEMLRARRLYGQLRRSKLHAGFSSDGVPSSIARPRRRPWKVAALVIALVLVVVMGFIFQHSML